MTEPNEIELRARFQELRDDRPQAPAFDAVVERAEARASRAPRVRPLASIWIAAAAVVVLATGVVVQRSRGRDQTAVTAASISNWTSPTAGLLRVSGRELLAPRSVLSSTLDGVLAAPVKRKGGSR